MTLRSFAPWRIGQGGIAGIQLNRGILFGARDQAVEDGFARTEQGG